MSEKLKSVVSFASVSPGSSETKAHGLQIGLRHVCPDHLHVSVDGFSATADANSVTVTNVGGVTAGVDVLCECWHSVERAIGPAADLSPKPFVSYGGRSSVYEKFSVSLIGVYDGVNRYFEFPENVLADSVRIYHGGRRLATDEYVVYEGVPGTGDFDHVRLTSWAPLLGDNLCCDYLAQ